MSIRVTKRFQDIPFAHRQWRHDGHCKHVHGHNWDFEITFACSEPDACGFVVDFGKLGAVKELLANTFDHKLVLGRDDPHLRFFQTAPPGVFDLTLLADGSCEALAEYVAAAVNFLLNVEFKGRVQVAQVVVYEDRKNYATCQLLPG